MRCFARGIATALAMILAGGCGLSWAQGSSAATSGDAAWLQGLSAWRTAHEQALDKADGWLTLIGLEWLKPGLNTVGAAADNKIRIQAAVPDHIGMITLIGSTVQLLSPAGGFPAGFETDGGPPREGTLNTGDADATRMTWHGLSMVVHRRGDGFVLRIQDADSPTRVNFHGLHWYAPDERYRVVARWIPYKPPQVERIPTAPGSSLNMTAPGVAEFLLNGKVAILEPVLEGGDANQLFFIVSDTTSKTTTYAQGRYLKTGLPDHGVSQPGNLVLDFNRLYNPPCAYTPYATCPMPPPKNQLPLAIEAGEQRFTP